MSVATQVIEGDSRTEDVTVIKAEVLDTIGQILAAHKRIVVHQKLSMLEAVTMGCAEKANVYKVLAGEEGQKTEEMQLLLVAKERSSCCTRLCCNPGHSLFIDITLPDSDDVLMSLERPGCTCPCFSAPKCCLGCCAFTDHCRGEIFMHNGKAEGEPGSVDPSTRIGLIHQPVGGGGFTPTLEYFAGNTPGATPTAVVEGPTCFGGCSELCCDSSFVVSHSAGKSGDMGSIKHLRPRDIMSCLTELCTDSDRFSLDFDDSTSAQERAGMLATTFLVDYTFFEMDQGMCHYDTANKACVFTCCLCYCYGCLIPCNVSIGTGGSNGGEGGAPEETVEK